jgi:hypothetical protein
MYRSSFIVFITTNKYTIDITTVCLYIVYVATCFKTYRSKFYIKWYCCDIYCYDINCTFVRSNKSNRGFFFFNAVQGYATENMKITLKETRCWEVVCINLAQNRGRWWAAVKIVIIVWGTQCVNSLTNSVAWIYLTYKPKLTFSSVL